MDIDTGNAAGVETQGTGWFVGFGPWTQASTARLRHVPRDEPLAGLCVKWYDHPPGQDGGTKPISEGRTVSILASTGAEFRLDFSRSADFMGEVRTVWLREPGDYAAWGAGIHHRWQCVRRATIITVRWNPAP